VAALPRRALVWPRGVAARPRHIDRAVSPGEPAQPNRVAPRPPQAHLVEKLIKQTPDLDAADAPDAPRPAKARVADPNGADEGAVAEGVKACLEDGLFITVKADA
jgi:hypothetical protein